MKSILALLGLLSVVNFSSADVIVYRPKVAVVLTGNGSTTKETLTGYFVVDANSSAFAEIFLNAKAKSFFVRFPTNFQVVQINGGAQNYTVVQQDATGAGSFEAKGINSNLNTGSNTYSAPKVFSEMGFDLANGAIEEEKGVLAFDQKTTIAQNVIDGDLPNTVNRLIQFLQSLGNTQQN